MGGGGKGSAPETVIPPTEPPPTPVQAPVDPEAQDTTVSVENQTAAKQAALRKRESLFADADALGESAQEAGSVFSRTLGG